MWRDWTAEVQATGAVVNIFYSNVPLQQFGIFRLSRGYFVLVLTPSFVFIYSFDWFRVALF